MSYNPEKVVQIALDQVGYLEKASSAGLDSKTANPGTANYTKYARDIDATENYFNGKKQGQPWCTTFVNWCFVQAYGLKAAKELLCQPMKSMAASCKYAIQYYQKADRYRPNPELGAQIFFSWGHTGIVVAFDATTVTTVEGNTRSSNQEGVFKKQYSRTYPNILGYGCPDFSIGSGNSDGDSHDGSSSGGGSDSAGSTCSVILPVISNGSKSATVAAMQTLLEAHGFSCGRYGTDGDFGPDTEKALRDFQLHYDLTVDGVCGAKTWAALLGRSD